MTDAVVNAVVDSHLRVRQDAIPEALYELLTDALSPVNLDKERAVKEHKAGAADMPDKLKVYAEQNGQLIMPRGFAIPFVRGMSNMGFKVQWDDRRSRPEINPFIQQGMTPVVFTEARDYQPKAIDAIMQTQGGIVKAPPGAGKTVICLEAIRRAGKKAIILVNKKHLVRQWQLRAESFLGMTPGFIGDGKWQERDITIALQQTLHARRDKLDEDDWWSRFGFVWVDECHAVTAETWQGVVQRFTAEILGGMSATPGKKDMAMAELMLGPVIHNIPRKQLYERGVLVRPTVRVVPTKFGFKFKSTSKDDWTGQVSRNNYPKLVNEIIADDHRNRQVVDRIIANKGHCQLIVGDRLQQLYTLRDMVLSRMIDDPRARARVWMLTGKESLEERERISEDADESNCIIFSTVADEALDIPRLDRVYAPFPYSNTDKVRQIVGRGERSHKLKTEFIFYDFADLNVGPLENQYKRRKADIYMAERMTVERDLDNDETSEIIQ